MFKQVMRQYFLILTIVPFLISAKLVKVDKFDFNKPQWILKFADSLADTGDFYRAITEYKRSLFLFPNYEKNEWVNLQIGKLYTLGQLTGTFMKAADEGNKLVLY